MNGLNVETYEKALAAIGGKAGPLYEQMVRQLYITAAMDLWLSGMLLTGVFFCIKQIMEANDDRFGSRDLMRVVWFLSTVILIFMLFVVFREFLQYTLNTDYALAVELSSGTK